MAFALALKNSVQLCASSIASTSKIAGPVSNLIFCRGKRRQTREEKAAKFAPFTLDKEELSKPLPLDDDRLYKIIRAAPNSVSPVFYKDPLVMKFTNIITKEGNRELAERIVRKTCEIIKRTQLIKWRQAQTDEEKKDILIDPIKMFHAAMKNSTPLLKLMPIGRGGIIYQVPVDISPRHAEFTAMKWMRDICRDKDRRTHMAESLAEEIIAAANNEGKIVRKKVELHKQCEANRAYAHYRWN